MNILFAALIFIAFLTGSFLLILLVYVLFRAAALGWYKSKLDHMRELLHHTSNGGSENGKF